jgi:hypothetical protein
MRMNRIGSALVVFGVLLGMSLFAGMPAVAEIEVDYFLSSTAEIELILPIGASVTVVLSGTQTWEVGLENLNDVDGNGLEQVSTEIVQMDLVGVDPLLGNINIGLNPIIASAGQIEESINALPGTLDIPPFTPNGTGMSSFDLFFEIEFWGASFQNTFPVELAGLITYKPPAEGEALCSSGDVELFDENGNPTGYFVVAFCNTPNGGTGGVVEIEVDQFPDSEAQIEIVGPVGIIEVLDLSGPTTVEVNLTNPIDTDGNGQDQVQTEMVAMDLQGSSSFGNVTVTLNPIRPSVGEIEENVNNNPGVLDIPPFAPSGTADSFFDVYFEIEVGGAVLYNVNPARIVANNLTHKPPAEGETYCGNTPVMLFDQAGNYAGYEFLVYCHTPNPEPDVSNGGDGLPCPFSQGFWKNHPSAWPVTSLDLGNETYTQDELITLLKTRVKGDASLILAKQLIAAKLNVANGSDSANVSTAILDADGWLSSYPGRLPYGVKPSSDEGKNMTSLAEELDIYNNMEVGSPPVCDSYEPDKKKDSGQSSLVGLIVPLAFMGALVASAVWMLYNRRLK